MQSKPTTLNNINEEKIDDWILNYLNTPKFQTSLNSWIISTLSHKKNMNLSRKGIADKIITHEYIKDVENEILQNWFTAFEIENYNTSEWINLKYKNLLQKTQKKEDPVMNTNNNSLLNSLIQTTTNQSTNLNSLRWLNILIDEFLHCDDNWKIENYLGDLSSFDSEWLVNHEKIDYILEKVKVFLSKNGAKDMFLIPNWINLFHKLIKFTNTKIWCNSITIFLDYFSAIVSKFYDSSFDITKFYKLSFNVECLNRMIMKFYDNSDVYLRKIDPSVLKNIVDNVFSTVMKNYSPNNPVYFSSETIDKSSSKENDFGLSTNYILLLFFLWDKNFSLFKVLFRLASLRQFIAKKFENQIIKSLPFLDTESCIKSLNRKFCFWWYHSSVWEKVFTSQKINKKFLLYCWISIKWNFLGWIWRYKSLRRKFYEAIKQVEKKLNCFWHFRNVLALTVDLVVESKQDFEDYQRDNLFYLTKEIWCDFILYCENKECCWKKQEWINEILGKEELKSDKMICYLFNDLQLAFKDSIFTHSNS